MDDINNIIKKNAEIENLKCENFLLKLEIDSLKRDREIDQLKDLLKLQNKILNNYEELKSLNQEIEILFLETDKLIEEIKKIDKEYCEMLDREKNKK